MALKIVKENQKEFTKAELEKAICEAFAYESYILRKCKKREPIHPMVFKKYKELKRHVALYDWEFRTLNTEVYHKTLSKFVGTSFDFNGYYKIENPRNKRNNRVKYGLVNLLLDSCEYVSKRIEDNWVDSQIILCVINALTQNIDKHLSPSNKKLFTPYKISVLTTYISVLFGAEFSDVTISNIHSLKMGLLAKKTEYRVNKFLNQK